MSALKTIGGALELLAEYQNLSARDRNYYSCIWAGRLSVALGDVAAEVCGPHGEVVAAAHAAGADTFATDIAHLIRALDGAGRSEGEIVQGVLEVIVARMEVGLPEHTWFSPNRP